MSGNAFLLARRHSVKNEHDLVRKYKEMFAVYLHLMASLPILTIRQCS
jgi:hypothetical protein